jgi:hypothetical protein
MTNKILILMSMICLFSSCKKETNLNDYITLKYHSSITLPSSNTTVSFKEVDDNRCPLSICYLSYGTRAIIKLSIASRQEHTDLNLQIWGGTDDDVPNNDCVDTLGYRFQILRLDPYPDSNPIDNNNYKAKIKITKL